MSSSQYQPVYSSENNEIGRSAIATHTVVVGQTTAASAITTLGFQQQQQQQQQHAPSGISSQNFHRRSTSVQGGGAGGGGVWSTSLSDVMEEPNRKSNCCALTCCGIFLSDRLTYWIYGHNDHRAAQWKFRMIPLGIYILMIVVANFTTTTKSNDDDDVNRDYYYGPSSANISPSFPTMAPTKPYYMPSSSSGGAYDNSDTPPNIADSLEGWLFLGFIISLITLGIRGSKLRTDLRRQVFAKVLTTKQLTPEQQSILTSHNEKQLIAAKGICCCYPDDRIPHNNNNGVLLHHHASSLHHDDNILFPS